MTGRDLILIGFERWNRYCFELSQRKSPPTRRKSLTDFYAEAFDEAMRQSRKPDSRVD
jgi:hypothetical protein